jgi:hypothetical protein
MILVGLCFGIITFLSAGFGLAVILSRSRRWNIIECVCLSWLLGTGTVTLLLWVGGIFFSGTSLRISIALLCAILGAVGYATARRTQVRFVMPIPRSLTEWLLVALIIFELINITQFSFENSLGWDGLIVWEVKARYAFLNNGVIPQTYFTNPPDFASHPEYPLCIPLAELWLYLWIGAPHQFWAKTIFAIFYCVGTILLTIISTRITGKRWIGLLIGVLLFFVPYLTSGTDAVVVGYVDFPLSVFYLAAIGYLVSFLETNDFAFFRLFTASASLLPWLKQEGAILFLVSAICATIVILSRKLSWRAFAFVIPPTTIFMSWQFYLQKMHVLKLSDFVPVTWATFQAYHDRILPILRITIFEMTRFIHWSLFWLLVAIAFGYLVFRRRAAHLVVLALATILPIAAYALAYVFSNWPNYFFHMSTSFPRLLLQVVPVAWLAVALALPKRLHNRMENSATLPDKRLATAEL